MWISYCITFNEASFSCFSIKWSSCRLLCSLITHQLVDHLQHCSEGVVVINSACGHGLNLQNQLPYPYSVLNSLYKYSLWLAFVWSFIPQRSTTSAGRFTLPGCQLWQACQWKPLPWTLGSLNLGSRLQRNERGTYKVYRITNATKCNLHVSLEWQYFEH